MSYCRSNGEDSDVYLIRTRDVLECFGAGWRLEEEKPVHGKILASDWVLVGGIITELDTKHEQAVSFYTKSRQEMIDHLLVHRAAGHKVPDYAIERLEREILEEGDTYE